MREKRTIVMNGKRYDAATGKVIGVARSPQVLARPRPVMQDVIPSEQPSHTSSVSALESPSHKLVPRSASRHHTPATAVHSKPQRSQTLHRAPLKKPAASHAGEVKRARAIVAKSPHITRFVRHQPATRVAPEPIEPATPHPRMAAIHKQKKAHLAQTTPISSRAVKEHLIKEQLHKADTARQFQEHPVAPSKKSRLASLTTVSLALMLLGGYLTYLNMPHLSMRVAATRAGIDASMPQYHPDGYRFNGPITFSEGQVVVGYAANGGPQEYTITQKASDWDSQAVLDSYILEHTNEYNIHSIQGLTVYTYNDKAVWVNRGILHEITYKDTPLSHDQIERIAASM